MSQQPLINGTRHSWSSIEMELLGRIVTGVTAISYGNKQDKKNFYGSGNNPVHRGLGNKEPVAKIKLYAYEVDAIQKSVGPGKGIEDIKPFDIPVMFIPEGQDQIVSHVLRNVEFLENKRDMKQGDMSIEVELDLIISHIEWS